MLEFKKGNIFRSNLQTITNPVNCVGVMGAGLAKQFKNKFPNMFEDYVIKCRKKELQIGKPYTYKDVNKYILNFPTKYHWKEKSKYTYIEKGLEHFRNNYKNWGINSIAFPPLGCGLGGLDWKDVKNIFIVHLSELDISIEVFEP